MKVELSEKRYALLLAAKDSEYVKKVHGGYLNVFFDAFGGEGEKWDLFRVVEGEFPEVDDLHSYEGFVISGSPHDAYAHETWILHLCFLLQTLFAMQKKLLGICFGHQVYKFIFLILHICSNYNDHLVKKFVGIMQSFGR